MMNNKFTTKSQEALSNALMTAAAAKNPQIEPAHTTQALLEQQDSIAVAVLKAIGVDPAQIISRLMALLKKFPTTKGDENYQPSFSRDTLEVIQDAQSEAENMGDNYISTEHLLLAVAAHKSNSTDSTGEILREAGATHEALLAAIPSIRGNSKVTTADPESTFQALEKFGTDLTAIAASGKLDPVIGRNSEIRRVIQVLSRRTKNNPVLIGEPGVGKTAVVEGLAQRIVAGDVPDSLRGKILMSLDLSAMVAGAKYRGEFEERLKAVLQEIKDSDGQIVTFIDEIHTVVGAGTSSEGAMDAGNMLKPMLARGELRLIGATTLDEYRENIEKDPALERRFQQVYVGEPSVDDTIGILRGLKERYEAHHKVAIADNALVAAARLSNRYIIGRQLPDKAIDLVDEAASRLRMEIDSAPEEIDQLRRSVDRFTMEELALKEETDPASMERLEILRKDMADKKEELDALNARWEAERSELNKMGDLKAKLDELRSIADKAQRDGDLEEASRILYGEIPALEQKLRKAQNDGGSLDPAELMVSEEVTADDIAEVVSAWTGIPAGRMLKGESEKLLGMEGELGKRLIGQKKAVEAVSDSIRRSRAGLSDPNRPAGSFMFLGPTGTGKTELAKALAEFLFDDERAMVRIDMSEYSEKYTVARLVGAPPGYVGYEEGGQLTEAIRRRPYSVVLLDEIEKAHPEVFDILLQVLDDGRLTDGQGRTVDFTNTILVLTSNLGSQFLIDSAMSAQEKNKSVMEMVSMNFKPEFLNRLDDIITFEPLTPTELASIVTLQVDNLAERLQERRLTLEVTDAAKDWLAITGYDPAYGARPLRRLIQREVGDRLAKEILSGAVKDGDNVLVDTNGDFAVELSGDRTSTDAQKDGNGLIITVKERGR